VVLEGVEVGHGPHLELERKRKRIVHDEAVVLVKGRGERVADAGHVARGDLVDPKIGKTMRKISDDEQTASCRQEFFKKKRKEKKWPKMGAGDRSFNDGQYDGSFVLSFPSYLSNHSWARAQRFVMFLVLK
jgi:hypothetical protein